MPLTDKGTQILSKMRSEYGTKRGTSVFYASRNAKKITGVEAMKKNANLSEADNRRLTEFQKKVARNVKEEAEPEKDKDKELKKAEDRK